MAAPRTPHGQHARVYHGCRIQLQESQLQSPSSAAPRDRTKAAPAWTMLLLIPDARRTRPHLPGLDARSHDADAMRGKRVAHEKRHRLLTILYKMPAPFILCHAKSDNIIISFTYKKFAHHSRPHAFHHTRPPPCEFLHLPMPRLPPVLSPSSSFAFPLSHT